MTGIIANAAQMYLADFKTETIASKTDKVFSDKVALSNYPRQFHASGAESD